MARPIPGVAPLVQVSVQLSGIAFHVLGDGRGMVNNVTSAVFLTRSCSSRPDSLEGMP
jgi:hypothetical protein